MDNICKKCANRDSCNPDLDFKAYECNNYIKKSSLEHVSTITKYKLDPGDKPIYVSFYSDVDAALARIICRKVDRFTVTTVDVIAMAIDTPMIPISIPTSGICVVQLNDVELHFKDGRFDHTSKANPE